jgi:hypothetical protein
MIADYQFFSNFGVGPAGILRCLRPGTDAPKCCRQPEARAAEHRHRRDPQPVARRHRHAARDRPVYQVDRRQDRPRADPGEDAAHDGIAVVSPLHASS